MVVFCLIPGLLGPGQWRNMSLPSVAVCRVAIFVLLAALVFAVGCSKKETSSPGSQAPKPAEVTAENTSIVPPENEAAAKNEGGKPGTLALPLKFARHTGDLDEMMKHRRIRALITI